jgi:1,4-dihydroxy-2-naphthoyl-CoA hydrolase
MTSLETLGGFVGLLGLRLAESSEDHVVIRWPVRPELLQADGTVHRGVFCTVVETAASAAASSWLDGAGRAVPVSMQTDFVADAREGELTATARPIHRGRSQQLWTVDILDAAARLIVRGQVRLQNLPPAGSSAIAGAAPR